MNNTKKKIIPLFSKDLDRELTIHQIKKELKRSYHFVYDNVQELIKENVLNKKTRGHSTVCTLNLKNDKTSALLTLNSIEEKEHFFNNKKELKPLFNELIDNLTFKVDIFSILLFGSYAKGIETKQSDVDILIIAEKKDKDNAISREIRALETKYGKEINQIVINRKIFKDMLSSRTELNVGKETLANHVILYGAEMFWRFVLEIRK